MSAETLAASRRAAWVTIARIDSLLARPRVRGEHRSAPARSDGRPVGVPLEHTRSGRILEVR